MYAYQTNAIVALILMIGLVIYMYSICNNYLGDLIHDEDSGKSSYQEAQSNSTDIVKRL